MTEYAILKKYFYGMLERRYFGDVSDRERQSIPFSWSCHREGPQQLTAPTIHNLQNSLLQAQHAEVDA